jgi:transaldolase
MKKIDSAALTAKVHEFVMDYTANKIKDEPVASSDDALWKRVVKQGSTLWLDTGDIDSASKLWNNSFTALTTNNTLLNNEIQKGIYDGLVPSAAMAIRECAPGIDDSLLILEIAFILNAVHGMRLAKRFGGKVSVELHTDLAYDVERSVSYGRRYHAINPENFIVKVPLTPAGLLAVRHLSDAGIDVNFTLGFSARQNVAAALISKPAYVNVFMGRLNAFVSTYKLGEGINIGEKATLVTQRMLHKLVSSGKTPTKLIGASIRNGTQLEAVIGTDVLTMPPSAAKQYHDMKPEAVVSHVNDDLPVPLANNVSLSDFNGQSLWDLPDGFAAFVEKLGAGNVKDLTAQQLQNAFSEAGYPDMLPEYTAEETAVVDKDGKIPVFGTWKEKLSSGRLGLDSIMNFSALRSFTADQKALDNRITGLI